MSAKSDASGSDSGQRPSSRVWVGSSARRTVMVSAGLIDSFVALSGDSSPVHVDDGFARARGFQGRLAHGMLLGALVSSVIGTELPGEAGVLQEMKLSFHNPCYVGDEVSVEATATELHEATQTLSGRFEVRNASGLLLVKGQFRSGLQQK